VASALARQPVEPLLAGADPHAPAESSLPPLASELGLCQFEADVLVLAAAPDFDLRYERVYAYLQDDVGRRRATVGLALDLLCASAGEHLARRRHFGADAPLLRGCLVHLVPDPDQLAPPLLAHALRVDDQVIRMLLRGGALDARLAPFCRRAAAGPRLNDLALPDTVRRGLALAATGRRDARLYFHGPPGSGRRSAAAAFAAEAGRPLLMADAAAAARTDAPWRETLGLLLREAALDGSVVYLHDAEAVLADPADHRVRTLATALAVARVPMIVGGTAPWPQPAADAAIGLQVVPFGVPPAELRRGLWRDALQCRRATLTAETVDAVAGRFRLTPGQIGEAAAQSVAAAAWRGASTPDGGDLFAAARAQCGHQLEGLAVKLEPAFGWEDLVLHDDAVAQLHELCARVIHRDGVMTEWRLGASLRRPGVAALFAGPPGTGKTMAAEIVAGDLGLDLYRIDLSGVVSKWIGETEKNLGRIFGAAEGGNAILLFDEAEALFGKRSEVRDSHDRYANVEIAYLLQRIESHDGVSILATNQAENLDTAFRRRIDFIVRFPLPEEAERRRIWQRAWPAEVPMGEDVDFHRLARDFTFSGAEIRNAALAAAFLAAEAGTAIRAEHVMHAVRREYEKLGRTLVSRAQEPGP
jgi:hypothetical protein